MQHRNLRSGYEWTTAAIADILERGTATDWRNLARRIAEDPTGSYAQAVRQVLNHTHFYGTTVLWRDYLDQKIR